MAMAHRPRDAKKTGLDQSEIATYVLADRPQTEGQSAIVASPFPWPWRWRYEAFSCTRSLSFAVVSAVIRSRTALNARGDAFFFKAPEKSKLKELFPVRFVLVCGLFRFRRRRSDEEAVILEEEEEAAAAAAAAAVLLFSLQ